MSKPHLDSYILKQRSTTKLFIIFFYYFHLTPIRLRKRRICRLTEFAAGWGDMRPRITCVGSLLSTGESVTFKTNFQNNACMKMADTYCEQYTTPLEWLISNFIKKNTKNIVFQKHG